MKCRKVRELLPLYVEEDLSPKHARSIRLHLATCALCREEEAAFLASQAFWKETPAPAFDQVFHADVRRAVRLKIDQKNADRARWWGIVRTRGAALAMAAAAATGIAFLEIHRTAPPPRLITGPTPAPLAWPAPSPLAVADSRSEPESHATRHAIPRLRRAETAVSALSRVTRIEMRTNNPNVRIIWLAKVSDAAPI